MSPANCLLRVLFVVAVTHFVACDVERRPPTAPPEDLRPRVDLAVTPPDLVEIADLTPEPEPDLTTEPDLAMSGCSLVGLWDVGIDNLLTMDARGGFIFEFGPTGRYQAAGDRFTVIDDFSLECGMPGVYRFSFQAQCSLLTMRVVNDPCVDRIMVFEMQDWVRR